VGSREIRHDCERAPDQLDRALVSPALMRDQSEQVQGVGMIGGLLQHFPIKRLGPVTLSRLVMGIGRVKIAKNLGCSPGVLSIAQGCHFDKVPNLAVTANPAVATRQGNIIGAAIVRRFLAAAPWMYAYRQFRR